MSPIYLGEFPYWSFIFAHKLTVSLGICHILPLLLNLPLAKVIFSQRQQKKLYCCHSWDGIHEVTGVCDKETLFFFQSSPLSKWCIQLNFLWRWENSLPHGSEDTLLLGPQSNIAGVQQLKKILTKHFQYFLLSLPPSSNSPIILPTKRNASNKQTDAISTKSAIPVA